jgi:predicted nucleotide-binding protein (sugar kinase/HSP70/actin superfamily)
MVHIGIPRALQFYQHYPLWRTFFEGLGAETVVSPPTNRDIVTAGAKAVADVTCLPVKVYAGHVAWLRDHGNVDFVFTPAIWNLEKDAFHCAKFKGLPDIMKSTVPDCPALLDIEIDPQGRELSEAGAFYRLGRRFTWNALRIRRAWARAKEADEDYRSLMIKEQITYPEALARLYSSDWAAAERADNPNAPLTIGLVGHPYCLYDDYLNHNLLERLGELGVRIVTSEMVSVEQAEAGVERTTGQVRWFYEKWMSGAAGHFLHTPDVDGVIAALAFACAPDSAMVETIARRAHTLRRSFMSLILDEHGSPTGMVTRLEAFVDMLTRQKQARLAEAAPPTAESNRAAGTDSRSAESPPPFLRQVNRPVLGIPSMGTTIVPLKSLFRGIGAQLELGPPVSRRTMLLGARASPEFICTPYKQILGNMIEMLEAGADTLIYVDGLDLCRNSSYHQLLEDALRDLGYKFRLLTFGQILEGGVFAMPRFLRQFAPELTWQDVVREIVLALTKMYALDEIERRVQYLRPRESTPGSVDRLWEESQRRIDKAADREAVKRAKADLFNKFNGTPIDPTARPVKIATTGEIFAMLDPFYNMDVERELGKLGAEVHRTLMMSHWVQGAMILEALGFPHRPDIARVAKPYLRWNVSGEGWVTVGETILHARKGFDGMVELLPFTCAPEVTALNILPRVSRDHNIPVIPFIFDEQLAQAGMRTRLEAFVDLLRRRRAIREASARAAPEAELPRRTALGETVCLACPIFQHCRQSLTGISPASCALAVERVAGRAR